MKKFLSLLIVAVMVLSMIPAAFAAEAGFTDVEAGKYYVNPIDWAVDNGVTNGTGDGTTFSPKDGCTRKQVVTFLWRAAGEPEASVENPFTDIPEGKYYTEAVLWAYENEITLGKTATTFQPDATCTRSQIVTFLYRYMGEPEVDAAEIPFPDVASGKFYTNAVLWAAANGITQGNAAGNFQPDKTCTRGDIVTFLFRNEMNTPVSIASAAALSEIKLYPETTRTYLINGRLATNVLTIAAVEGLTVTVDGIELVAQNGLFTTVLEGAPNSVVVLKYTGKEAAEIEASIDAKGGENAPISINASGELSSIDVAAAGEAHYAINGRLSGQYITIAAAEGVTVTVGGKEVKAVNGKFVALLDGAPTTSVVVKNAGKEDVSLVAEINWAEGTEGNPIAINAAGDHGIDVAAKGETYVAVSAKLNGNLLIMKEIAGVTLTVNDKALTAVNGLYKVTLDAKAANNTVVIANTTAKAVEATLTVIGGEGTETNPYAINAIGDTGYTVAANGTVYYAVNSLLNGNNVVIEAKTGLTVTVNGKKLTAAEGFFTAKLDAKGATNSVVITSTAAAEGVITVIGDLGTESNPIVIDAMEDLTGVEAKAGTSTYYAISAELNGLVLTVDAAEEMTVVLNGLTLESNGVAYVADLNRTPVNKLVITAGKTDVATPARIYYPAGTINNPIKINEAADMGAINSAAGSMTYYNISSYLYGKEMYIQAADGVVVTLDGKVLSNTVEVGEEEPETYYYVVLGAEAATQQLVVTNQGNTGAELIAYIQDIPGTEGNPITVDPANASLTVPAGETVYYQGRVAGMMMTLKNALNVTVTYNETVIPANMMGMIEVSFPKSSGFPAPMYVFAITNNGEEDANFMTHQMPMVASLTFTAPGSQMMPDELVIGTNTASIAAGDQGYFYNWTATADGTLNIEITFPEDWTYTINNITTGIYGDQQWNNSDPVVNPGTVEVSEGDVIEIIVNTYNPENMWENPAGEIVFTATFTPAEG